MIVLCHDPQLHLQRRINFGDRIRNRGTRFESSANVWNGILFNTSNRANIVFAKARNVCFFLFVSEMKVPHDYPKTIFLLQGLEVSMYVVALVIACAFSSHTHIFARYSTICQIRRPVTRYKHKLLGRLTREARTNTPRSSPKPPTLDPRDAIPDQIYTKGPPMARVLREL